MTDANHREACGSCHRAPCACGSIGDAFVFPGGPDMASMDQVAESPATTRIEWTDAEGDRVSLRVVYSEASGSGYREATPDDLAAAGWRQEKQVADQALGRALELAALHSALEAANAKLQETEALRVAGSAEFRNQRDELTKLRAELEMVGQEHVRVMSERDEANARIAELEAELDGAKAMLEGVRRVLVRNESTRAHLEEAADLLRSLEPYYRAGHGPSFERLHAWWLHSEAL